MLMFHEVWSVRDTQEMTGHKDCEMELLVVQSRTQSNACSRVRLALALGKRNELRMISYALT